MSATTLHDFLAVCALVALGGVIVMIVTRIVPSVLTVQLSGIVHRVQLPLAALVATTASLGSLWFSEYGDHWQPCRLCWFQRIFMYSSAVVLIVAALRRDRGAKWYAVPLASLGMLVSLYHILLERGVVTESDACSATVPCAIPYRVSFGHINDLARPAGFPAVTLAVMAFCGFAAILAVLLLPEALDTDLDTNSDTNPSSGEHS